MQITYVAIDGSINGRYALACVYRGARYHIWIDPATLQHTNVVYKNPPRGVKSGSANDYKTRYLKAHSRFCRKLIAAMLEEVKTHNLFAKFKQDELEKQAQEESKRTVVIRERERIARLNAAAPYMLTVLKMAAKSMTGDDLIIVRDAIRRAEEGK